MNLHDLVPDAKLPRSSGLRAKICQHSSHLPTDPASPPKSERSEPKPAHRRHTYRPTRLRFAAGAASRDERIDRIWGDSWGVEASTVDEDGFAGAAWQFVSLFIVALTIFYLTPRAFERLGPSTATEA